MQGCSSDVLRSVNGTASKCPFLATATEECCPARGTLAGHFTRRLSPSPMPGKRIQQQRAYLPLKRSSPRPQFYRSESPEIRRKDKEHPKKKLDNPAVFSVYSVHTEMSDNTKTSLTPVAQKFILHWGEMGTKWGINRTVAQVHALLFLSAKPVAADEIAATLAVARSNVSTSLRELQGWGIVRVVHVLGDRRDHFESVKDVWEIFRIVSEERKRREIDPTVRVLRECVEELRAAGDGEKYTQGRLEDMLEFLMVMTGLFEEVVH